jgi:hypothetical protein
MEHSQQAGLLFLDFWYMLTQENICWAKVSTAVGLSVSRGKHWRAGADHGCEVLTQLLTMSSSADHGLCVLTMGSRLQVLRHVLSTAKGLGCA